MRLAVFGAGRMADIRIQDLITDSRVTDVSIVNRNASRAHELAAKFGALVDVLGGTAARFTAETIVLCCQRAAVQARTNPFRGISPQCDRDCLGVGGDGC